MVSTRYEPDYQLININSTPSFRGKNKQRGLLESDILNEPLLHRSPFKLNSIRHWKWWNFVTLFIIILSVAESVLFIVNCVLLSKANEPIIFGKKTRVHKKGEIYFLTTLFFFRR